MLASLNSVAEWTTSIYRSSAWQLGVLRCQIRELCSKRKRIVMVGLDGAGKTTLLYRLKLGTVEHASTIPSFERVVYKKIEFMVWDLGGLPRQARAFANFYRPYLVDAAAIIFVVDSNDRDSVEQARVELHRLLEDVAPEAPLLVFANKMDLPNAMDLDEVANRLDLHSVHEEWHLERTFGGNGSGAYEGLEWLSLKLQER